MKAYKGFNRDEDGTLWCRGFQYEVGKTYKFEGEPIPCVQGFHACREPHQCWSFYPNNGKNAYFEVECGGKIVESGAGDGKFVCTEITLVREISSPENKVDDCGYFHNGYARVELDGKYNFIDTEGKYLSKQWWGKCTRFCNGYAIVGLDGKYNFIDIYGNLISELWFDGCYSFYNGYAIVGLDGKYYEMDTSGKITEI